MDTVQTEYAVIGCALADSSCHAQVAALPQDAFTTPQTVAMHNGLAQLFKQGVRADAVTLANAVRSAIATPQTEITTAQKTKYQVTSYRAYEGVLLEERRRRIVRIASSKALSDCDSGASVDSVCQELMQAIKADGSTQQSVSSGQALIKFVQGLDKGKDKNRCKLGIPKFDRMTGGLRGGKLVIIGARPGVGKTALALAMAVNAAQHTGPVLMVSLEMDEEQVMSRIVSSMSGVDCEKFESGGLTQQDYQKMGQWFDHISKLPLRIATKANTPVRVRRQASAMKYNGGLSMIVVDYIQLMKTGGKNKSRYEEVSEISRQLKILAADMGVPVVALTQFNRDSEKDGGMPTMAQAKDSGSIEQDANLFLILWPVPQPTENTVQEQAQRWTMCQNNGADYMKLIVAKNRQGRTGIVDCYFWKKYMRFRGFKEDA